MQEFPWAIIWMGPPESPWQVSCFPVLLPAHNWLSMMPLGIFRCLPYNSLHSSKGNKLRDTFCRSSVFCLDPNWVTPHPVAMVSAVDSISSLYQRQAGRIKSLNLGNRKGRRIKGGLNKCEWPHSLDSSCQSQQANIVVVKCTFIAEGVYEKRWVVIIMPRDKRQYKLTRDGR